MKDSITNNFLTVSKYIGGGNVKSSSVRDSVSKLSYSSSVTFCLLSVVQGF